MTAFRNLPNLSALRAFEAAERHQNFSRAAEEIHLTHSAVSHQVRALEEELGVPLFIRNGKRVAATPEAQRFAQALRGALGGIAAAAEELRQSARHKRLKVSSIPSFAARWLAPRLGKFIELHPDIELTLESSSQLLDLAREPVDVGIRFGAGHYPGLLVEKLMEDHYYPVASPGYHGGRLPQCPADLAQANLLRSDEPWAQWFAAAGLDWPEPSGGLLLLDLSLLVRSAVAGDGVALVRHAVAAQEIASGQLVRLFGVSVPSANSYHFACTPSAARKPQVQAFRAWLFAEVAAFPSLDGVGRR